MRLARLKTSFLWIFVAAMACAAQDPVQNPYLIETLEDLESFRDLVNDGGLPGDFEAHLMADIDLASKYGESVGGVEQSWTPIGTLSKPFKGVFDGNGYSIKNLYVNHRDASEMNSAFFGWVEGAQIRNLNLEAYRVYGSNYTAALVANFRSFVEDEREYSISNVSLSGEVEGTAKTGALVAYVEVDGLLKVSDVHVKGAVKGGYGVGGLIGHSFYCEISESSFDGVVQGQKAVGALVGSHENSVLKNVEARGEVEASTMVGGLVGDNHNSSIVNSTSYVLVKGNSKVGGLVGTSYSVRLPNDFEDFENPVTRDSLLESLQEGGALIFKSRAYGEVQGESMVAGFVGEVRGTWIVEDTAYGKVEGLFEVGGLVGNLRYGELGVPLVYRSLTTGPVKGEASVGGVIGAARSAHLHHSINVGPVSGEDEVGGLIGRASSSFIEKSINLGGVIGLNNVGGLVGAAEGGEIFAALNSGIVKGDSAVGGIAGELFIDVTEYYDQDLQSYLKTAVGKIQEAVNVAFVEGKISVGALIGEVLTDEDAFFEFVEDTLVFNNFYDQQMCPLERAIFNRENSIENTALMTRDMLHEALKFNDDTQKGLSNELWAFSKDFYPRLIELTEEPAMRVASAPIILKAPENVLAVSSSFLVKNFEFLWDYSPENHVQKGEVIEESLVKMKALEPGEVSFEIYKDELLYKQVVLNLVGIFENEEEPKEPEVDPCEGYEYVPGTLPPEGCEIDPEEPEEPEVDPCEGYEYVPGTLPPEGCEIAPEEPEEPEVDPCEGYEYVPGTLPPEGCEIDPEEPKEPEVDPCEGYEYVPGTLPPEGCEIVPEEPKEPEVDPCEGYEYVPGTLPPEGCEIAPEIVNLEHRHGDSKLQYFFRVPYPYIKVQSSMQNPQKLHLYDLKGNLLLKKQVSSGEVVSLESLKAGLYFAVMQRERLRVFIP